MGCCSSSTTEPEKSNGIPLSNLNESKPAHDPEEQEKGVDDVASRQPDDEENEHNQENVRVQEKDVIKAQKGTETESVTLEEAPQTNEQIVISEDPVTPTPSDTREIMKKEVSPMHSPKQETSSIATVTSSSSPSSSSATASSTSTQTVSFSCSSSSFSSPSLQLENAPPSSVSSSLMTHPHHDLWLHVGEQTDKRNSQLREAITKFISDMKRKNGDSYLDESAVEKAFQEEETKYADEDKKMFDQIFAAYDMNASNALDLKEVRVLAKEYISNFQKCFSARIKSNTQRRLLMKTALILQSSASEQEKKDAIAVIEAHETALETRVLPAMAKKVDEMLSNYEKLADGMFAKMDENKDGIISREEFYKHYLQALFKFDLGSV